MVAEISDEYRQTHSFRDYFVDTYVKPMIDALVAADKSLKGPYWAAFGDRSDVGSDKAYIHLKDAYQASADLDDAIDLYAERFGDSGFVGAAHSLVKHEMSGLPSFYIFDVNATADPTYKTAFNNYKNAVVNAFDLDDFADSHMHSFTPATFDAAHSSPEYQGKPDTTVFVGKPFSDMEGKEWMPIFGVTPTPEDLGVSSYEAPSKELHFGLAVPLVDGVCDFDNTQFMDVVDVGDFCPEYLKIHMYHVACSDFAMHPENRVPAFSVTDTVEASYFNGKSPAEVTGVAFGEQRDFMDWARNNFGEDLSVEYKDASWDNFGWDQLESFAQGTDTSVTVESDSAKPSQLDTATFDAESAAVDKSLESDQFGE